MDYQIDLLKKRKKLENAIACMKRLKKWRFKPSNPKPPKRIETIDTRAKETQKRLEDIRRTPNQES